MRPHLGSSLTHLEMDSHSKQTTKPDQNLCRITGKRLSDIHLLSEKESGVFHHFKGTMARFVMGHSKLLQSGPSAWGGGFSASHTISRASGAIFTKTLKRLLLRMVITVGGEISVAGFLDTCTFLDCTVRILAHPPLLVLSN